MDDGNFMSGTPMGGLMSADPDADGDAGAPEVVSAEEAEKRTTEARQNLVKRILDDVKAWEKHWSTVFKQMKADTLFVANHKNAQWEENGQTDEQAYVANITYRTIQAKVADLYAKNPRVKADRRQVIDYQLWDGRQETLQTAVHTVMMAQQAMQAVAAGAVSNMTGMPPAIMPPQPAPMPIMDPGTALAIVQEAVAVRKRRDMIDRIGKTAEILFHYYIDQQRPRFKSLMKQAIRRAATCKIAWIQMDFERQYDGFKPETQTAIDTTKEQVANMMALSHDVASGDLDQNDPKVEDLQLRLKNLQAQPDMISREGLVFDFPKAWDVIPDQDCTQLVGLVGCKRLARRFVYTTSKIKARFNIDLKDGDYTAYKPDPRDKTNGQAQAASDLSEKGDVVWYEVYDSEAGLVYSVADGYKDFLTEPSAPRIKTDQFFPLYPIVLNEVENDCEALYPPSEVDLIRHQQKELNRSREALRQHRIAGQPFWVTGKDKLDDDDINKLKNRAPHDVLQLRAMQSGQKVQELFQPGPAPPIDPNLYEDRGIMQDVLRVAGAQEANLGPTAGNTATEAGIAESSRSKTVSSNVDDINDLLTDMAADACSVMLREVSLDTARKIAGPGAVWPESTGEEYVAELSLKVVAGSMGKPNRDRDAAAFERIMPIAVQVPGINPAWLAKKTAELLDEAVDLDDALLDGIPSVLAMNSQLKNLGVPGQPAAAGGPSEAQPPTGNPATDPDAQADAGANNAPTGMGSPGGPQAGYPIGTAAGPVA